MAGTIGTYGVTDYSALQLPRVLATREGVSELFVQGVIPDGRGLTTTGVELSLRRINPPTATLTTTGNKPTLIDPGHPT